MLDTLIKYFKKSFNAIQLDLIVYIESANSSIFKNEYA